MKKLTKVLALALLMSAGSVVKAADSQPGSDNAFARSGVKALCAMVCCKAANLDVVPEGIVRTAIKAVSATFACDSALEVCKTLLPSADEKKRSGEADTKGRTWANELKTTGLRSVPVCCGVMASGFVKDSGVLGYIPLEAGKAFDGRTGDFALAWLGYDMTNRIIRVATGK